MKKNKKIRIAIVQSTFNRNVSDGLLEGAKNVLDSETATAGNYKVYQCPGAFEIPALAKKLTRKKNFDAIICLGAVIKGETAHFEYISSACTIGIQQLTLQSKIPVIFGVLTCYTEDQAIRRSSPDENNKGAEAAHAALEMIKVYSQI